MFPRGKQGGLRAGKKKERELTLCFGGGGEKKIKNHGAQRHGVPGKKAPLEGEES